MEAHEVRIVVITDEPQYADLLAYLFSEDGYTTELIQNRQQLSRLGEYDVMICDLELLGFGEQGDMIIARVYEPGKLYMLTAGKPAELAEAMAALECAELKVIPLEKPHTMAAVLRLVEAWVQQHTTR